jgi:glycosyltransferase involved in cell wall biosynthesis
MDKFLVTLVVASKDPPREALIRCLSSFNALNNIQRIQLVLVESGVKPNLSPDITNLFADVRRLLVPAEGVYAAYNSGIGIAEGKYLLFFGVDDIALPGMDIVLEKLDGATKPYCLFAASCYMQGRGIVSPSSLRHSLIFANWCHQGIFYSRHYLHNHRYDLRYRVHADHKANIEIVSNCQLRSGTSRDLIAYFSAGGVSSLTVDLAFRNDFPSIVNTAFGWHWGWLVRVKQMLIDLFLGPPVVRINSRLKRNIQ